MDLGPDKPARDGLIVILRSTGPEKCVKPLLEEPKAPPIKLLSYDDVLENNELEQCTYIFTDFDRLTATRLIDAARLYRRLKENGCRVLNDPARVLKRAPLLRALFKAGLNPFNVYPADEASPERFPVFIRIADDHNGPRSDLIHDQASLEAAIEAAVTAGLPRSEILVTEYAAEPIRSGIFCKSSLYRIGDHFVPDVCWYASSWAVNGHEADLEDDGLHHEELRKSRANSYPKKLESAFAIANIEYGRLDYAVGKSGICIYEINTYPTFFRPRYQANPERAECFKLRRERLLEAFHAIDTDADQSKQMVDVGGSSIAALNQAQQVSPVLRSLQLKLSQEHARRGDLDAALTAAEAAVAAAPRSRKALSNLSVLLDKQGREEEAIAVLHRLLPLYQRDPFAWCRLGWLLCRLRRYDEARERLLEGLDWCGDHCEIYLCLSQAHRGLGDALAALEAAKRAAAISPEDPKVEAWIGKLALETRAPSRFRAMRARLMLLARARGA